MGQYLSRAGLIGLAMLISGCAGQRATAPSAACYRVTGHATSWGRSIAEQRAVADLKRQAPDARGEMLDGGYGRLKASQIRTTCAPYHVASWSTPLATCTALATICGRLRR